jgi:outer membrane biosynthesis protein TonB
MYDSSIFEKRNEQKGKRVSFVVHILLLLIAFFYYLPKVDSAEMEDKPPYAIKLDLKFEESSLSKFAHDDSGLKRAKSEAAPQQAETKQEEVKPEQIETTNPQEIKTPLPDIKMPTPVFTPTSDPIYTSTVEDEAPVKAAEKPVYTPAPSPKPSTSSSPSTSSTSGSTTGTSTSKPSSIEGNDNGTGKGDSGTGAGKDKGNDGDAGLGNSSDGLGEYDGSGDGVFGRRVVYRDIKAVGEALNSSGTVAVKICVNRGGNVTYTEVIGRESTIKDNNTLKKFLKAAKGYKVQLDLSAPKEQCGKLIFKGDNSVNKKIR